MRLSDKIAVVTGAGGGIGRAVVRRFLDEGCSVVATDINGEVLEKLAAEIGEGSDGERLRVMVADVAKDDDNASLVQTALEAFGGLDIFHANAAVQVVGSVDTVDRAGWQSMFDANLFGVASGFRHASRPMRTAGRGSLIATASVLGLVGDPDLAPYGAMKGGVRALVRSMATSLGPEGIRVNTICPGDVETPMVEEFFQAQPDPEAARREISDRYPLRRFADPDDVAAAALFLASDDASYISGIDIIVDGGLLARVY